MTAKEHFLRNSENLMPSLLSDLKIDALLSEGDADNDIVTMALKTSQESPNGKVIESNIYLLILLVALSPINPSILYFKQSIKKVSSAVICSIKLTNQLRVQWTLQFEKIDQKNEFFFLIIFFCG